MLRHYEGLVFASAQRLAATVEDDVEDIRQVLRVKVYRALLAYDPVKSRGLSRDRYVFMCLKDQCKDLLKKRRRGDVHIEDLGDDGSRERFDGRYLSASHDEVYGAVEDAGPFLPGTLTDVELRVIVLLYRDFKQSEAAAATALDKREMERVMRSIREKLADGGYSSAGGRASARVNAVSARCEPTTRSRRSSSA